MFGPVCGRTALTAKAEDLRDAFGLSELPTLESHYNVPPSQPVAVCRESTSRERRIEMLRWGLVPHWAKDTALANKLALARVEGIANKSAFKDAVRNRRCLVIVSGFFEWRREGKRTSTPFFVRAADGGLLALAAVWDRWVAGDGEVIESCAIITQPSRAPVDAIHDRMPLILERETWARWLEPVPMSPGALQPLLEPRTPDLVLYPVSSRVNDPRHDVPACIQPADPTQLALIG